MCLDEKKGELAKVFWTGFFFTTFVSARSQASTTDSRLVEDFNSLTSDIFSAILSSPSCMYAK